MTKKLLIAGSAATALFLAFFAGTWWQANLYLQPLEDEVVMEHFYEAAVEALDQKYHVGVNVLRESEVSTLRAAGISCLVFLPRSNASEWQYKVCFNDNDSTLIEVQAS